MIASLALGALLWPATITDHCQPPNNTKIVGVAQDINEKFLYCEIISQTNSNQLHIDYTRSEKVFATKDLTFSNNPFTPEVMQVDSRSGEKREATVDQKNVVLKYQETKKKKMEKTSIALHDVDILDAGFDNFVRARWDDLASGKVIPVSFASIAHQKALPLRISTKPLDKCVPKPADKNSQSQFCIWVDIDNVFLRMMLGNIKLTYDQQHRLQKFDGVVNIQSDSQDNQNAVIHYFYSTDYSTTE
jgi:hypothetical protein